MLNLQPLLEPRSVAIVGASAEPKKISGMIVGFLEKSGYAGGVYPVNPRYERIGNLRCFPSIDTLPETVDLVVCVVPAAVAFDTIEAAARRGVPFCLLMTGGFGEGRTGAEGEARRQRLLAICNETGMQVVGPNTVGMVNFRARLPLTFADWYARDTGQRGGVAIVTHSGSVGGLIFSSLQLNGIGVDYWFGLGNEATLETADFISHFSDDPAIHTVICYMEGVRSGQNFIRAATEARRRGKHIVAIRAGGHPESARSTLSHTGKRPSGGDVYAGIFRQLGIIEAASLSELSYVMTLLTTCGERLGSRVGVISASGGACSLIADHTVDAGLELPELPQALQERLNRAIPEYGSSLNPVDLSADVISRMDILDGTLAALRDDESIDVWLVFGRPIVDRYYQAFIDFARHSSKAVIVSCGVPIAPEIHSSLREGGIAVLQDPELCLRALGRVVRAKKSVRAERPQVQTGSAEQGATVHPSSASPRDPQGERMASASSPAPSNNERFGGSGLVYPREEVASRAQQYAESPSNAQSETITNSPSPARRGMRRRPGTASGVGMGANITARIEHDADFGLVLALTAPHIRCRVVRALPATDDDLRDALEEIAERPLPQAVMEQLRQFAASATRGARIELSLDA